MTVNTIPTARPIFGVTINNVALAALILRVSLGMLFLAHVWVKIVVFTPAGTFGFFQSLGLPGLLAYMVIAVEVFGGLALIFGVYTRTVALVLMVEILGTIAMVHGAAGFFFTNEGGGWEYPALWAVALLVQALIGNGLFAVTSDRS